MYHVAGPWGPLTTAPIPRKLVNFDTWLETIGREVVAEGPVALESLNVAEMAALGLTVQGKPAYDLGEGAGQ
ncbi:MAG: hypothetical protein AAFR93_14860 [Pseudomonadota bacterium]